MGQVRGRYAFFYATRNQLLSGRHLVSGQNLAIHPHRVFVPQPRREKHKFRGLVQSIVAAVAESEAGRLETGRRIVNKLLNCGQRTPYPTQIDLHIRAQAAMVATSGNDIWNNLAMQFRFFPQ
jgi:hypothetical protein